MPTELKIIIGLAAAYGILLFLRSGKSGIGKIIYAIVTRGLLIIAVILIALLVLEKCESLGVI